MHRNSFRLFEITDWQLLPRDKNVICFQVLRFGNLLQHKGTSNVDIFSKLPNCRGVWSREFTHQRLDVNLNHWICQNTRNALVCRFFKKKMLFFKRSYVETQYLENNVKDNLKICKFKTTVEQQKDCEIFWLRK